MWLSTFQMQFIDVDMQIKNANTRDKNVLVLVLKLSICQSITVYSSVIFDLQIFTWKTSKMTNQIT